MFFGLSVFFVVGVIAVLLSVTGKFGAAVYPANADGTLDFVWYNASALRSVTDISLQFPSTGWCFE